MNHIVFEHDHLVVVHLLQRRLDLIGRERVVFAVVLNEYFDCIKL
jgi:hypothetical protein